MYVLSWGTLTLILLLGIEKETDGNIQEEEAAAQKYLKEIDFKLASKCHEREIREFDYKADINDKNAELKTKAAAEEGKFTAKVRKEIREKFPNWKKYKNELVRTEILLLHTAYGPENMPEGLSKKFDEVQNEISQKQSTVTICDYKDKSKCDLKFNPDIAQRMRTNPSPEKSEYYWTEWHDAVGSAVNPGLYGEYVNLSNIFAESNGLTNFDETWYEAFDDRSDEWSVQNFREELHRFMDGLLPYYKKFHAYVRMKLKRDPKLGALITKDGYIPIHILNHMYGLDWSSVVNETMPYPDMDSGGGVTEAMEKAGFTPTRIVKEAEKFFVSLDPSFKLSSKFWNLSMFERPEGKEASCHPTAYDLYQDEDVRLHVCITVNEGNLKIAYHEVGHLVYFLAYRHLPSPLRIGSNPGFHEAIGDAIALSVTQKHFKCILGLELTNGDKITCGHEKSSKKSEPSKDDINTLFLRALGNLPNIPYSFAIGLWRTKVFNGSITPSEYNDEWWKIRKEYMGLVPPKPRSPKVLDVAIQHHIVQNMGYVEYYTAYILQYQFYEAMCIAAGEYDPKNDISRPLHQCDFSNSPEAGKLLKNMMSKGGSKDWKTVLEEFTGSREMSIEPLIHYYKPLFDFIDKELKENNEKACYGPTC